MTAPAPAGSTSGTCALLQHAVVFYRLLLGGACDFDAMHISSNCMSLPLHVIRGRTIFHHALPRQHIHLSREQADGWWKSAYKSVPTGSSRAISYTSAVTTTTPLRSDRRMSSLAPRASKTECCIGRARANCSTPAPSADARLSRRRSSCHFTGGGTSCLHATQR